MGRCAAVLHQGGVCAAHCLRPMPAIRAWRRCSATRRSDRLGSLPRFSWRYAVLVFSLPVWMRAAQENGRGKAGLRGTSGDPSLAPPYDHVHHIRFTPALSSQPESPTQSSRLPWRKTPRGTEQRACVRHAATTRRRRWMDAQSASPVWLWSRGGPQLDYSVACRAVQDLLPCPTHASARISPTDSSLPQRRRAEPTARIRTAALRCAAKSLACCARPRASAFAKHRR